MKRIIICYKNISLPGPARDSFLLECSLWQLFWITHQSQCWYFWRGARLHPNAQGGGCQDGTKRTIINELAASQTLGFLVLFFRCFFFFLLEQKQLWELNDDLFFTYHRIPASIQWKSPSRPSWVLCCSKGPSVGFQSRPPFLLLYLRSLPFNFRLFSVSGPSFLVGRSAPCCCCSTKKFPSSQRRRGCVGWAWTGKRGLFSRLFVSFFSSV